MLPDTNTHAVDSYSPAEVSRAALSTFEKIVDAWGLKPSEAMTLLGYDGSTEKSTNRGHPKLLAYGNSEVRQKLGIESPFIVNFVWYVVE